MRDRIIRYAFVLAVALTISGFPPQPLVVQAPNPSGYCGQVSGIRLVCLQGDPYEMGLQQGTLLREPLRALVREYLYERIVLERGTVHAWLLTYTRFLEREVPGDLRREMQGIAEGAGLSYQDVLLLNTVPDLLALTYGSPSWELCPPRSSPVPGKALSSHSPRCAVPIAAGRSLVPPLLRGAVPQWMVGCSSGTTWIPQTPSCLAATCP